MGAGHFDPAVHHRPLRQARPRKTFRRDRAAGGRTKSKTRRRVSVSKKAGIDLMARHPDQHPESRERRQCFPDLQAQRTGHTLEFEPLIRKIRSTHAHPAEPVRASTVSRIQPHDAKILLCPEGALQLRFARRGSQERGGASAGSAQSICGTIECPSSWKLLRTDSIGYALN